MLHQTGALDCKANPRQSFFVLRKNQNNLILLSCFALFPNAKRMTNNKQ